MTGHTILTKTSEQKQLDRTTNSEIIKCVIHTQGLPTLPPVWS